jgi:hypothetical protein
VFFYPVGELLCPGPEVLKQDVPAEEIDLHRSTAADRAQASFEQDAIKTCYDALDSALVPFQK